MERQKHGFVFEEAILAELGATKEANYTGKWDGYIGSTPISVKNIKMGSAIDMGDYFRNAHTTEDFLFIVNFYDGSENEVHFLFIPGEKWQGYFSTDATEAYAHVFDGITNDPSDDAKWTARINGLKKKYNTSKAPFCPRFKRDHKSQRRVQGAINNKMFYNHFLPEYEVSKDWVEQNLKV